MSSTQPPGPPYGYPPQGPPLRPESPFPPIRKKPWWKRWWAILAFIVVGLLALYALLRPDPVATTTAEPVPTVTVTATETVTAPAPTEAPATTEPDPTTAPAGFNPKPKDFQVAVKILTKECFGSAGCSITYRIKPTYVGKGDIPTDVALDVTYEISGAEDPIVGTFTVEDAKAQFNEEESASTTSSSKKLTAKVTEVTVQ